MAAKLKCTKCDSQILQTTFNKTDGLCMTCYQLEKAHSPKKYTLLEKSPITKSIIFGILYVIGSFCSLYLIYDGINIAKTDTFTFRDGRIATEAEADFYGLLFFLLGCFLTISLIYNLYKTLKKSK